MKNNYEILSKHNGLTMAGIAVISRSVKAADFLYIGDGYDNTVKRFDANTGANTPFVPSSSGGLDGPRGLIFIPQQHTLVVAVDQENDDGSIHHTHRAFPEKI